MKHEHEPSEYAVNLNAAEGAPLWCDECGEVIQYRGSDADGRATFGERDHRIGEGTFCQPMPLDLPA